MGPIEAFKVYRIINKYLQIYKGEFKMKFSWNLVGQIIGTTLQGINAFSSVIPAEAKPIVTIAVTFLQGLAGIVAHFYTTNGTPVNDAVKASAMTGVAQK